MNQKGNSVIYVLAGICSLVLLVGAAYYIYSHQFSNICTFPSAPSTSTNQNITKLGGNTLNLSKYIKLPKSCLSENQSIMVQIGFKLRDQAGFDAFLKSVNDPTSPNYRHFAKGNELTDKYGISQESYDQVISYVESYGFKLTQRYDNRLLVDFQGTKYQAEQAFHVSIDDYKDKELGRIFYANDTDPGVPDNIAPYILSVNLNNLAIPHPAGI